MPDRRAQGFCFITLNGGHDGQEEKGEEGGEEKEKEEGSRTKSEKEVAEEACKESGQEEGKAEIRKESRGETVSDGGIDVHGVFDGVDARRGENCPEPRGRLALSHGLQALKAGDESSCTRSGAWRLGLSADPVGPTSPSPTIVSECSLYPMSSRE